MLPDVTAEAEVVRMARTCDAAEQAIAFYEEAIGRRG
jgi:hypothetical protein